MVFEDSWLWGEALYCCVGDVAEDGFDVGDDRLVGESQDEEAAGFEDALALAIALGGVVVDRSVDLDDETGYGGVEVDEESVDGVLSAEFDAAEA